MKGPEFRHLIIRVPTILPEFFFFFLSDGIFISSDGIFFSSDGIFFLSDGILFSSDVFCYHATILATTTGAPLNKGIPKDLW